jgi:hypothetical protein
MSREFLVVSIALHLDVLYYSSDSMQLYRFTIANVNILEF